MAGERRESDFMNKSLDEIAAEMDSSLYEREDREGHHRPQHRFSPYPADHGPSWRAEKEGSSAGVGAGSNGGGDVTKVFAANLNYTVTWQKLKDHVKKAGPVIKCDLFKNVDGSSRGMGLVMFADSESADRAIRELNGTELDGRKIFLRKDMRVEDREKAGIFAAAPKPRPPPNPSATVFVANLDYALTWQKLRDIFKVAGKIIHVDVLVDTEGRPKGCASIQFETTADAMNAIILFHGQMLQNRPMVVRMDSKSAFQPDPIQLKLQIGKGGLGAGGLGGVAGGGVSLGSGAGLLSALPTSVNPSGGLAGNVPLAVSLGTFTQPSPAILSQSALGGQLPLLAALGLSALTNLRHFSPEQLTLLGINPALVQTAKSGNGSRSVGGGGGAMGGVSNAPGPSSTSILGQREHRQEGLLSQLPFLLPHEPSGQTNKEKDFSFLLQQHTPTSSTSYNATMATNLSLATALATPTLPTSLTHSGHEPMADVGRKGKKLFIRNINFATTWQLLKDHLKPAGAISYVDVLKNADGRSKGCATVVFETEEAADKAIRMYDQSELDGRRISVIYDRAN